MRILICLPVVGLATSGENGCLKSFEIGSADIQVCPDRTRVTLPSCSFVFGPNLHQPRKKEQIQEPECLYSTGPLIHEAMRTVLGQLIFSPAINLIALQCISHDVGTDVYMPNANKDTVIKALVKGPLKNARKSSVFQSSLGFKSNDQTLLGGEYWVCSDLECSSRSSEYYFNLEEVSEACRRVIKEKEKIFDIPPLDQ